MSEQRLLMVLGAGIMQIPVLKMAQVMGLKTLVLDASATAPGVEWADDFLLADISKPELCWEALSQQRPALRPHGVVTVGTDFSTTVAYLAEKLKRPRIPLENAWKAKNKALMRQTFAEQGVSSPRFILCGRGDPAPNWTHSYPAVVKPVDNMGARGVKLVQRAEDLSQALEEARRYSVTSEVIVEEYVEGPEFSLDAIVRGDEIQVMGFADRHIFYPPYFIEMGHTFPSVFPQRVKEKVVAEFKKGIRALGIDWGAAKGDIKWNGHRAVVGEIAARLSGGFMSGWTYPLHSGRSSIRWAIETALGDSLSYQPAEQSHVVLERALLSIPGVLKEIQYLEDPLKIHDLKHLFLSKSPGDKVNFPQSNVEKWGNFILGGESLENANLLASRVRKSLFFRLAPNQESTSQFLAEDASGRSLLFSSEKGAWTDSYGWNEEDHYQLFFQITGKSCPKTERSLQMVRKGGAQALVYFWDSYGVVP